MLFRSRAGLGLGKSFISTARPYFGSWNREQKPVGCPRLSPRSRPRLRTADQPLSLAPRATALDRYRLQKAGFTHVLNAAHGSWNVDTGPDYYRDMAIEYHGVEADDLPTFDLSVFFYPAAAFIDAALRYDHSKRPSARTRPRPQPLATSRPRPSPRPHPQPEAPPLSLVGRGICTL